MAEKPVLTLYNTLTRSKEPFAPIDPDNVRMYVCGPTVYDFAHIGNARPVIVFDVLFRLLRHVFGEDHVTYARNITDVDDKINARALRDFGTEIENGTLSLNEAIRRVTEKTANQFHADIAALGAMQPTHEPRATEFVQPRGDGKVDMITLIERLIERGHAYQAGGEVLFDTQSMADYGRLSRRNLDEQQAGARVAVDVHKKNPGDFVLWKLSSPEEPGWESPWGRGRPGWHIECSAMSAAYLGETFDIHGGGLDLIFPHHENEIAQSRCAHGTPVMSNVWMHNGFLQVEGRKMSKSEGNFLTISELLHEERFGGRRWDGEVLRLAMLMTHYRQPIDFSVKRLEEAEKLLDRWYSGISGLTENGLGSEDAETQSVDEKFVVALTDDLNTSDAIAWLNRMLSARHTASGLHQIMLMRKFRVTANLMGFLADSHSGWEKRKWNLRQSNSSNLSAKALEDSIEALIQLRLEMLKAKNFAEADRIRDDLAGKGIQLKDGKDPQTGERVTTWEVKR